MAPTRLPFAGRSRQRGMGLVEVLVSLLLLTLVMLAFLGMLDTFSAVAKTQGDIADATENLRFSVAALVRLVRMAGTGGLPLVHTDAGGNLQPLALAVEDNVDGSSTYQYGGRTALANTDVLHVRGIIRGELYDVAGGSIDLSSGNLTVSNTSPWTSNPQVLAGPGGSPGGRPIFLGLQVPLDITASVTGGTAIRRYGNYRMALVEDDSSVDVATDGSTMTVSFVTDDGGTTSAVDLNPGGAWSTFNTGLAYSFGFVDDMVFFIANNEAGEPSLYRFMGSGAAEELVPNISQLQLALGCDVNLDGTLAAGEWFNGTGSGGASGDQFTTVREVRLSLVARSQDPDLGWQAEPDMPANAPDLTTDEQGFRYRTITVRVALRSHPPVET